MSNEQEKKPNSNPPPQTSSYGTEIEKRGSETGAPQTKSYGTTTQRDSED